MWCVCVCFSGAMFFRFGMDAFLIFGWSWGGLVLIGDGCADVEDRLVIG